MQVILCNLIKSNDKDTNNFKTFLQTADVVSNYW